MKAVSCEVFALAMFGIDKNYRAAAAQRGIINEQKNTGPDDEDKLEKKYSKYCQDISKRFGKVGSTILTLKWYLKNGQASLRSDASMKIKELKSQSMLISSKE